LNNFIQQKLPGELVQILPHKPTGKVELKLNECVKVDFRRAKAFNYILGFDKKEYTERSNIAENCARINIKSNLINSETLTSKNNIIERRNLLLSIY